MSVFQALFGKRVDPVEQAKEWRNQMRTEDRKIDKQIRDITLEETKVKKSIKEAAKKGDMGAAKILARALIGSKKAKARLFTAKAQLNSVVMQLTQSISQTKIMGALQKSVPIMQAMSSLCKLPEVSATMRTLSQEMIKAGILEEMVDDSLSSLDDIGEEETDEAVDKVMQEVLQAQFVGARAGSSALPSVGQKAPAEAAAEEDEEDAALMARIAALQRS